MYIVNTYTSTWKFLDSSNFAVTGYIVKRLWQFVLGVHNLA